MTPKGPQRKTEKCHTTLPARASKRTSRRHQYLKGPVMFQVRFHGRGGRGIVTATEPDHACAWRADRPAYLSPVPPRRGTTSSSGWTKPRKAVGRCTGYLADQAIRHGPSSGTRRPSQRRRRASGCWWWARAGRLACLPNITSPAWAVRSRSRTAASPAACASRLGRLPHDPSLPDAPGTGSSALPAELTVKLARPGGRIARIGMRPPCSTLEGQRPGHHCHHRLTDAASTRADAAG